MQGERYRHKKRGTTYEVVGVAELQVALPPDPTEGAKLVVYRCEADGRLWARRQTEFLDGRFERLPPVVTAPEGLALETTAEERASLSRYEPRTIMGRLARDFDRLLSRLSQSAAEERGRIVAWLNDDDGKTLERDPKDGPYRVIFDPVQLRALARAIARLDHQKKDRAGC